MNCRQQQSACQPHHELAGGHKAVHGFLTGIKKEEADGFPDKNISLDQAAAENVGSATRFASINTGIGDGTDLCWTRAGIRVPPINNPANLFRGLFVNSPQSEREAERVRLTHRSSVLDALRESAGALNRTLNAADRNKLDQYLTSVRDVEQRLQMSKEWIDRPKPKSPIDEVLNEERKHIDEMALLYDLMALTSTLKRIDHPRSPIMIRKIPTPLAVRGNSSPRRVVQLR